MERCHEDFTDHWVARKELGARCVKGKKRQTKSKWISRWMTVESPGRTSNSTNGGSNWTIPSWSNRTYWKGVVQREVAYINHVASSAHSPSRCVTPPLGLEGLAHLGLHSQLSQRPRAKNLQLLPAAAAALLIQAETEPYPEFDNDADEDDNASEADVMDALQDAGTQYDGTSGSDADAVYEDEGAVYESSISADCAPSTTGLASHPVAPTPAAMPLIISLEECLSLALASPATRHRQARRGRQQQQLLQRSCQQAVAAGAAGSSRTPKPQPMAPGDRVPNEWELVDWQEDSQDKDQLMISSCSLQDAVTSVSAGSKILAAAQVDMPLESGLSYAQVARGIVGAERPAQQQQCASSQRQTTDIGPGLVNVAGGTAVGHVLSEMRAGDAHTAVVSVLEESGQHMHGSSCQQLVMLPLPQASSTPPMAGQGEEENEAVEEWIVL